MTETPKAKRLSHSRRKALKRSRPTFRMRRGEVRVIDAKTAFYRCTECGTAYRLGCGCGDLSCAYNDCDCCDGASDT